MGRFLALPAAAAILLLLSCSQHISYITSLPGPGDSIAIGERKALLLDSDRDGVVDGIDIDGDPAGSEIRITSVNTIDGIYQLKEPKSSSRFFMFVDKPGAQALFASGSAKGDTIDTFLSIVEDANGVYLGMAFDFDGDGAEDLYIPAIDPTNPTDPADTTEPADTTTLFAAGDTFSIEGRMDSRRAIAFDTDGRAHIAYTDTSNKLFVVSGNGTGWEGTGCDPSNGVPVMIQADQVKLVGDTNGVLYLGAKDLSTGELIIRFWDGSAWVLMDKPDNFGNVVLDYDIAFDGGTIPCLLYLRSADTALKMMQLYEYSSGSWLKIYDLSGYINYDGYGKGSANLLFDELARPIVSYATDGTGSFTVMKNDGSNWYAIADIPFNSAYGITLAYDPVEGLFCGYIDTSGAMVVEEYDSPTNSWTSVSNGVPYVTAGISAPSLDFNPVDGGLYLSLGNMDASRGEIYTYDTSISQWMQHGLFQTMATAPSASSLGFDGTGLVFGLFSYYDTVDYLDMVDLIVY